MSFSVVIPSRNATNLIACVRRVREMEGFGPRIIIVDDGLDMKQADATSRDGCWLCDMDPTLRVSGRRPFIFSRNINIGIAAAGTDDVIFLNDDALLMSIYGFRRMEEKSKDTSYGIISAVTNLAGNPAQHPTGRDSTLLRDETRTVAFVCVYIPRRTITSVGLLDERFITYGWEDNDYCRRARNANLKIGIFDGCFVDHGSLRSTFRGDPKTAGDIEPGAQIYRSKWGNLE